MDGIRISGVFIALLACAFPGVEVRACTSGAANGEVTLDGRPLVWKSRTDTFNQNDVRYYEPGFDYDADSRPDPYGYLGMGPAGGTLRMGLNSRGVATAANTQYEGEAHLPHPMILGNCASLDEAGAVYASSRLDDWRHILFAIDAGDDVRLWEANAPGEEPPAHYEYDVTAPARDAQVYNGVSLSGWVVRAGWGFRNEDGSDDLPPIPYSRYQNAMDITSGLIAEDRLSARSILRDFMRDYRMADPYVVSSMVVQGVLPEENPSLSTMWTQLGFSRTSIAVPVWVAGAARAGGVSEHLEYDAARERQSIAWLANRMKQNRYSYQAVEARAVPFESHLFDMVDEVLLPCWRPRDDLENVAAEMDRVSRTMASDAHRLLDYLETNGAQSSAAPDVYLLSSRVEGLSVSLICGAYDDDNLNGLPDGEPVSLTYDFGGPGIRTADGFLYDEPGRYLVSATATDAEGLTQTEWLFVEVGSGAVDALLGDANLDGAVTDADYTIWADNYGAAQAVWEMGDFNRDGQVTDADYTVWADHYGAGTAAVPEPASTCLCGAAMLALALGCPTGGRHGPRPASSERTR